MKKLFSLLLTFLCLHVYAQKNPFEFRPLKGKVKSVSIKGQNLLPPRDTTRFSSHEELTIVAFQYDTRMPFSFEYDSKGNIVYQNDYDFIYRRKFNNNNQLTEFVEQSKAGPHKRIGKK
ncbi:hypothetical protein SAMN05421820_11587 [Pedobacter steynii]|uniref:DUF4968 domain-containing protein n=1 Tax=Pedobacter steynii TaxID=430522 RepID=A0A1H0JVZ0_9SPHI|nr:hypothetical protein [Pedobacter steynii]NQX43172.1 hypothetical protein [Pedobacter steynii]SDO47571.1 hypothetical protein SAMN05421820_11587 [Pedobacter steynii]